MKIAVTCKGKTLDDQIDPRFGRCPYFLVVDTDTLNTEPIENPNLTLGGGAGIQSAQLMAEHDVQVVLTGNCGPNAYQTLNAADVEVIVGTSGTAREAVEKFKSGASTSTQGPNVASHFGTGADAGLPPTATGTQSSTGQTVASMGGGMAMGQGMGGGGGGSRGMGGGGGGGGGGRGMGGGMGTGGGRGMGIAPLAGPAATESPSPPAGGGEMDVLKAEAQNLADQLQAINARIAQTASGSDQRAALVAVVNAEECTGCGFCEEVCSTGAITIDTIAAIDVAKCTGCGQCVAECPPEALTLKRA